MLLEVKRLENGVFALFKGKITSKEIVEANDQLLALYAETPYSYQIIEFDDVEDFIVSSAEMRYVAIRDIEAFTNSNIGKVAIVCSSTLVYGMARMYDAYASESPAETQIFNTLDEALIWVNEK